jgi:Glycosyltransferase
MKVCIYSGVISLDKNNTDVRKNYLLERIKYLGEKDFSLEVLSPYSPSVDYLEYNNLHYRHYPYIKRKGIKLLSCLFFSFPILINLNCNMIHCLNYQSFFVAHIANILRKNKFIIIFESMGLADAESSTSVTNSFKVKMLRPFIRFFENYAFRKSDGVIVYNKIIKDYVVCHFRIDSEKVFVVPHGVDIGRNSQVNELPFFKEFSKFEFIAMYVGSLSRLHGTPYLMSVILELSAKRPEILFLVLGTGPFKEEFETFIEKNQLKNVILAGYISSTMVPLYLKKADVLLIPHSKCLQTDLDPPTKLFEYLHAGIPIVSFNFKAVKEIVGSKSVLVEPDDSNAFAEGILKVLDNKDYYSNLAKEAISIVDSYSWKASAEELFNVYMHFYMLNNEGNKRRRFGSGEQG